MTKTMKMRLLPALLGAAFSSTAGASGFQLLEQDASGIGNAYAGSAATAESAGTIFYNPAGMTQLRSREVSVGVTAVTPSFKFSNKNSDLAVIPAAGANNVLAGNGGDGGGTGYVPNAYLSWAVDKDLYLGLGIGAPFGLATEYDQGWIGGAQSLKFNIVTQNINPSIAWRMNETVSLGFGLDWQTLDATYKRQIGTADYPLLPVPGVGLTPLPLASSIGTVKLSDDAWGWNAGVLFTLSPATKVGVSYRSAMDYQATGSLSIDSTSAVITANEGDAKADIKLPDTLIVSGTHQLNPDWQLLGDASWTGWSSIPKVDIVYTDTNAAHAAGDVAQTLTTDFRDTWRVAVGANYRVSDTYKVKMGIAYDQTPVKNAATRLVSLPDNDRTWLSLGGQWKVGQASTVDVGAAYLIVKDAPIDNDQSAAPTEIARNRGRVNGTYKDSAWMIGAQYSTAF